jgi:hypothetical protein
MKPKIGDVVVLDDGLNYIIVAILEENGQTFFNLMSEDLTINRYCVEAVSPDGAKGWKHILEEDKLVELTEKFGAIFNEDKELQEYLKTAGETPVE